MENENNMTDTTPNNTSAYKPPEVDIHAGYEPPQKTAPYHAKDRNNGKLVTIIILLICILAVETVSLAMTLISPRIGGNFDRIGRAPDFSQSGSDPVTNNNG